MVGIKYFCGLGNSSFKVWNNEIKGVTECFQWLCLSSVTHGIFSMCSAYSLGSSSKRFQGRVSKLAFTILVLAYLHALAILTEVTLAYTLGIYHPPAYVLSEAIKFSSWLIYIMLCHNSLRINRTIQKQHLITMLCFVPLALSTCVNLYSTLEFHKAFKYKEELNFADYSLFVYCGLNTIFWIFVVILAFQKPKFSYYGRIIPSLVSSDSRVFPDTDTEGFGANESSGILNINVRFCDENSLASGLERSLVLGQAEQNTNFLSYIFFWWVKPLMVKGYKESLKCADDLFLLPNSLDTGSLKGIFSTFLNKKTSKTRKRRRKDVTDNSGIQKGVSLCRALHYSFGNFFYSLGILKFISSSLGFSGPVLLNYLVSFMENKKEAANNGYYYAVGLFISTLLGTLFSVHYSYQVSVVGMQVRSALVSIIYEKTLKVSTTSLGEFSTGQVINFMSTDTDRVANFCNSFHEFWSLPFQIGITLYLLYLQVDLAFLAGLAFAVLLIPVNRYLAIKIGKLSKEMMAHKDERVKMMNECLYGIRVIKLYAWEAVFQSKIAILRNLELKSLKGRKYLDALCVYFWATTPVIISILTFGTYILFLDGKLTAAKVFTSIALFNILIAPLNAFPWVINGLMESWISVKRIQEFVSLPESDLKNYYSSIEIDSGDQAALRISEGKFCWRISKSGRENAVDNPKSYIGESSDNKERKLKLLRESEMVTEIPDVVPFLLRNINFTFNKGQFIGIIGKVGSGKSSLLASIIGEMNRLDGQVMVPECFDGFGLVPQEPWIQHMTVRDNILFGKLYHRGNYQHAIRACALEEDFALFPNGEFTEVGEQGINLSGGQKARISLARAVYQDKDIYLLDDPLAAVDAHVATHLVNHCFLGILKEKTRILCTHHTKYLTDADLVLILREGKVIAMGTPRDLLRRNDLLSGISMEMTEESKNESKKKKPSNEDDYFDIGLNKNGQLIAEEEREKGVVAFSVVKTYYLAIGLFLSTFILIFLLLMQASRNLSDWWLAYWISNEKARDHISSRNSSSTSDFQTLNSKSIDDVTKYYLEVYTGIAISNTVFTLFRAFLFAYGGIVAATRIHNHLLTSVFNAKVNFFDITPIGRVMNRFSSDLYSIDDSLPFILNILLAQVFGVVGSIIVTCYGVPWFAAVLVPLIVAYYWIQNYYRKTSREIKRLYSVTLSPIYEHFAETLTGLTSIRAFQECGRFCADNEERLTLNQRAKYAGVIAQQWLALRLQLIGVAMVTVVSFMAVLEHSYNSIDPGLVGLAISYALSMTVRLNAVVRGFTETEKEMVNVERANQYIEGIEQEHGGILMVDKFWPHNGGILFEDVTLKYRDGLAPSLYNVSLYVNPREKIGICGRTGSGKSSLFVVLFQMVSLTEGEILIDGVNISHIPLSTLRSRLAIIPQDPFLFSDSIRANIDPTDEYPDSELWSVLGRCHMDQPVRELGGLKANVGEKGSNLSAGQRQLLCLARALLKRAKIICIDEATASVDMETDALIQRTIKREFEDSTVLTIAHRIETILDSDRVVVMDKGRVAEFGSPNSLLLNKKSHFHSLVKSAQRF